VIKYYWKVCQIECSRYLHAQFDIEVVVRSAEDRAILRTPKGQPKDQCQWAHDIAGVGETSADSSTSMSKERNNIASILRWAMYGFFCEMTLRCGKETGQTISYECAHCRSHSAESISHCGARL
jgi:hypothetical protein